MSNVSDFKIAQSILKKICQKQGVSFVDVPISFEEDILCALYIGKTKNIAHTIFRIVGEYIKQSPEILETQLMPDPNVRDNFLQNRNENQ